MTAGTTLPIDIPARSGDQPVPPPKTLLVLGRKLQVPALMAQQRLGMAILLPALALGTALRLWLAFYDQGIYWPDEIYQSLEPAHRLVFGYGLQAWEFIAGARNWTFPAFCAALLELATLIGLSSPTVYLGFVRAVLSLLGASTALICYRLARRSGAASLPAACGAALFALTAPAIYFAPRALGEVASGLPVVLGFALAYPRGSPRRALLLGASCLGLSTLLRPQNALFSLCLVGILIGRRQWRAAVEVAAVLVGWALIYGLIDLFTWGSWFHSAFVYWQVNFVAKELRGWTVDPVYYYPRVIWSSMRLSGLLMAGLAVLAAVRAPGLLLSALVFLGLHSAIQHKELRFIFPALPLLCALAGIGLDAALRRLERPFDWALGGAVLASAVFSAVTFHSLTVGDLGVSIRADTNATAYDDPGTVNRLLLAAYRQPDLCGLKLEEVPVIRTGGYSYLHRPIPIYEVNGPLRSSNQFNYLITLNKRGQPGDVLASEGPLVLLRLSPGPCQPDENYPWRLPGLEGVPLKTP